MDESKIINNRYKIISTIGKGGMAVVYKAFDTEIQRFVAIKVMRTNRQMSPSAVKRFDREAKYLAKLDHQNIVRLYDYGEFESESFLVMELVEGGTLKEKMDHVMSIQEGATLLEPVARGLAYAHDHGVIHRDIKPSNILVTRNGQQKVSDFGIAKLAESEMTTDLTGTNVSVGTPEYMSPEQGLGKPVDGRTDIYSLGLILYEMVTGKKPFTADTPLGLLHSHVTDPVNRPSQIEKSFPSSLDGVILKALEKDPLQRYNSMQQFADVLESIQSGQGQKKINRLVGRKKRKTAMLWLLLPIIIGLFSALFFFQSDFRIWVTNIIPMQRGMEITQPISPTPVLAPIKPTDTLLTAIPPTEMFSVEVTPTPTELLLGGEALKFGNSAIDLNNTNKLTKKVESQLGSVSNIELSPNNQFLLASSVTTIKILDSRTLKEVGELAIGKRIISFKISPDGKEIAILSDENGIIFWDIEKNQESHSLTTITDPVSSIDYSKDGKFLAVGAGTGAFYIVNTNTNTVVKKFDDQKKSIDVIRFSPDGLLIATGSSDLSVRVWKVATGESVYRIWDFTDSITAIAFSPDNQLLVAGPQYNNFNLYDLKTGNLIRSYESHSNLVTALEISPDSKLILSGSSDKKIRVWSIDSPYPLCTIQEHLSKIVRLVINDEGSVIYSVSQDGKINEYSIE